MQTPIVTLTTEPLWRQFLPHTMEMIITKEKGRKMFPQLEYVVQGGLLPDEFYIPVLYIKRLDENRYKYSTGEWQLNGKGESSLPDQPIPHAEGVLLGKNLINKKISFDEIRLTNNAENGKNMVMQWIISMCEKDSQDTKICGQVWENDEDFESFRINGIVREGTKFTDLHPGICELIMTSQLEVTQFIAVTAYFSEAVKKTKIELNKYAKGHREEKSFYTQTAKKSPAPSIGSSSSFLSSAETSPVQHVPSLPAMFSTMQPPSLDVSAWMSNGYPFYFNNDSYMYNQYPYYYPPYAQLQ